MKQDSLFHPLKLVCGLLAIVMFASLLTACGSLVSVGYQHPRYGGATVDITLPAKGGLSK